MNRRWDAVGVHLVEVASRADLVTLTGDGDVFARLDPAADVWGWALGSTVGVMRASAARAPSLFVWGPQVGAFLDALIEREMLTRHAIGGVSVPRPEAQQITQRFEVLGGGDWDWMWTTRRTGDTHTAGHRIVELDDTRDCEEITALAAVENPRFEGFPGTGHSEVWLGVRDDAGALIACGAVQRLPAGTAHLGGILVAAAHRRHGLGRAISAALTDRMVETEGVCTLGMYADNDAARALYASLGYVVDKPWASRHVASPADARTSASLGCGYDDH